MNNTSTAAILKILASKINELKRMQGGQLHGRWAQAFLESCLGFNTHLDYRLFYSDIGVNWRPTMMIAREGSTFCTMEVGAPSIRKYKDIPYGMLFTGHEWRLYDLQSAGAPNIMAVCDLRDYIRGEVDDRSMTALERDLSTFHEASFQTKTWETLAAEARKCNTESMATALLSHDVINMLKTNLGVNIAEAHAHNLLHHKIVEMLEGETPVKLQPVQKKLSVAA